MPQENDMAAKIQLSEDELKLMQNSDWILTKNRIIGKVMEGFGDLSARMRKELAHAPLIDSRIIQSEPKISRGEKYEGLPYVILDYPRLFGREHTLAVRTFYWWGNFCSVTLHLKGRYQSLLEDRVRNGLPGLAGKNVYLSLSGDEWNHDVASPHYTLLTGAPEQGLTELNGREFLKLSAKVEFSQWDEMERKLFEYFVVFGRLMEA